MFNLRETSTQSSQASNKKDINISEVGVRLRPKDIFFATLGYLRSNDNRVKILETKKPNPDPNANEQESGYILFQLDNKNHLLHFPMMDGTPVNSSANNSQTDLKAFNGDSIQSNPDINNRYMTRNKLFKLISETHKIKSWDIHEHYYICQTNNTVHYVYAYLNLENELTIIDSLPGIGSYSREADVKAALSITDNKYQYINTGDQYNSTDCGHYAIRHFLQTIGLEEKPSFRQRYAKTIGFLVGASVIGGISTLAIYLTIGFAAFAALGPVGIGFGVAIILLGGVIGAVFADLEAQNQLAVERERNQKNNCRNEVPSTGSTQNYSPPLTEVEVNEFDFVVLEETTVTNQNRPSFDTHDENKPNNSKDNKGSFELSNDMQEKINSELEQHIAEKYRKKIFQYITEDLRKLYDKLNDKNDIFLEEYSKDRQEIIMNGYLENVLEQLKGSKNSPWETNGNVNEDHFKSGFPNFGNYKEFIEKYPPDIVNLRP